MNRKTRTVKFRDRSSTCDNVRSNIIQLNTMGSDDDGYFVCAKVNEKPVTMLYDLRM